MDNKMDDHIERLRGKPLTWIIKGVFKPHATLIFENEVVASMKTTKYLSMDCEGSYGPFPVTIRYDKQKDFAFFQEKSAGKNIVVIDNIFHGCSDRKFHCGNGTTYSLCDTRGQGYSIENDHGKIMSINLYDAWRTPNDSKFILHRSYDGSIDPWLLALVGHYYSVRRAIGTPYSSP